MAKKGAPNYTQLVHDVVRSSDRPLSFREIFDRVNERQPITTKNPKGTIRNALTQLRLVYSVDDGRYGYFPHLLKDSLFRMPLTEKKPAYHPLPFTGELTEALWPARNESGARQDLRAARLRLPSGEEVLYHCFRTEMQESPLPPALAKWLINERAQPGDDLLFRVVDADARLYELQLQRRSKRDEQVIAPRNRELADAAYQLFRSNPKERKLILEIGIALMARSLYRDPVPPDPLAKVLRSDQRFIVTLLNLVMLREQLTPEEAESITRRNRNLLQRLLPVASETLPRYPQS